MLIGIVGKPSAGKSTFFKAATLAEAEIANYPFTTIKPNRAMGYVKLECVDKEFNKQCTPRMGFCIQHNRFVPIELLDVAGLVPGAHEGLGLGSQFLDDLRQADVLIHVIDISGSVNEKGEAVKSLSYDPLKDVAFLEYEINMWFYGMLRKGWEKFARTAKQEGGQLFKAVAKQLSGVNVTENIAEEVLQSFKEDITTWTEEEIKNFAKKIRERTKPILIAANKIDVPGSEENFKRLKENYPSYVIVPCSAIAELELRQKAKDGIIDYVAGEDHFELKGTLNEKETKILDYVSKEILATYKTTGVQDVLNTAVFDFLKYIAIFPGGVNNLVDSQGRTLPDCFLMKNGVTAYDFAAKIHTDLAKGFVRAIDVKKRLTVGKEHVLKHRDVIEIISTK
ncbi:MAG: redox-regulated ATPase YchF [Candidatus Nanoarchaeia archaeon]